MDIEPIKQGITRLILIATATFTTSFQQAMPAKPISETSVKPIQIKLTTQQAIKPEFQIQMASVDSPKVLSSSNVNDIKEDTVVTETNPSQETMAKDAENLINEITKLATPTPSPTATPTPTTIPIKKETMIQNNTSDKSDFSLPAPVSVPSITSLNADLILQLINNHRTEIGLAPFEKDDTVCQIAQARVPQLQTEVSTFTLHKGFYDMNLPFWATENMAYYPTEQQDMDFWLRSPVHRSAIEGNYKYSCGVCYGNVCAQIFTNYLPK